MSYYKDEKLGKSLGTIPVKGNKIIQAEVKKKKHVFNVVTKGRTYHIQAENEHEKQAWISALVQNGGIID